MTSQKKSMRERRIFELFVVQCEKQGCELSIDPDSIESRNEPEPDIFCKTIDGEKVAFELVEIADESIKENQRHLVKEYNKAIEENKENTDYPEYIRAFDPSVKLIRQKLGKKYVTGHPIELLCYITNGSASPDTHIAAHFKDQIPKSDIQFRRIWLFRATGVKNIVKLYTDNQD